MGKVKALLKLFDIFTHSQFLRYKGDSEYRSATGGVVSLMLIVVFIGIFAKFTLDTLNRNTITSTIQTTNQVTEDRLQIKIGPEHKFMFAAEIISPLNRSSAVDYDINTIFEIWVFNPNLANGTQQWDTIVMEQCTPEHWYGISQTVTDFYDDDGNYSYWWCPQIGQTIYLSGRASQKQSNEYLQIGVYPCVNFEYCDPDVSQILTKGYTVDPMYLQFYYVNPAINPSSTNYIDYYIQDKQMISFGEQLGTMGGLYLSTYSITTDKSLLPFSSNVVEGGTTITDNVMTNPFKISRNLTKRIIDSGTLPYAAINIYKSSSGIIITRAFQKIQVVFASIAGLFGAVIACLFFFNLFNQVRYEIEFGDKIFRDNQNNTWGSEKFNFMVFLGYLIYQIIAIICPLKWRRMERYQICRRQVIKQLDLHLIFEKMRFFQQVAHLVLQDYHRVGINLLQKPMISQMRKNRKSYLLQQFLYFQFHQLKLKNADIKVQPQDYHGKFGKFQSRYKNNEIIKSHLSRFKTNNQQSDSEDGNISMLIENLNYFKEKAETDRFCKKIMDQLKKQKIYDIAKNMLQGQPNLAEAVQNILRPRKVAENLNSDARRSEAINNSLGKVSDSGMKEMMQKQKSADQIYRRGGQIDELDM